MIPYLLIILGIISTLWGLIGAFRIAILPIVRAKEIVFKSKDDYIFYETSKGKRLLKSKTKFLLNIYITLIIVGILAVLFGFYVGFSEHGEDFWLYKRFFDVSNSEQKSDRISDEGKYIAKDGNEYNYYILIRENNIFFKDEACPDITDLKEKIENFDRTNTIVIFDDFAVSSTYHSVVDLLHKSGIEYIEESN